jgi:hypothetical protein
MTNILNLIKGWIASHRIIFFPLIAFLIPVFVRAIPEILMGQYTIGFDTMAYYVPYTVLWLRNGVGFLTLIGLAPLFYLILTGVVSMGFPIILLLKVTSPILLGFLGLAVFFFANKNLLWSSKKSLLVAIFSTLYFVALRISWDMLRMELGLIFLFVVMIYLKRNDRSIRNSILLSLIMVLVVFSHQLVALIMFSIIIATTLVSYFNKKIVEVRTLIIYIPSIVMFFVVVYAALATSQLVFTNGIFSQGTEGLTRLFSFTSTASLAINTVGFLLFCYLPLLPLLLLSAKKFSINLQLKAWIVLVLLALSLAVIIPNAFIGAAPYRWVLLLSYPLAFFAADAFSRLKPNWLKFAVAIILISLSWTFMVLPSENPFAYYTLYPIYVPTSMVQNTLPLTDCQSAVNALQWTKANMGNNSILLVHEVFFGWASLTFKSNQFVFYGFDNPVTYAEKIVENNSNLHVYLIWWTNATGWYGQPTVSSLFGEVYQSGEIAIYLFQPLHPNNSSS